MSVHPIEVESYRILAERVDLSDRPALDQDIVGRMIHATADPSFADSALIGTRAASALLDALERDAPVIVDAAMISAGITRYPTQCYLPAVLVAPEGSTRSAAAFALACRDHPQGAVFVVGNAPTALFELIRLYEAGEIQPAVVVGLPVGFVGAKESKAALWASGLASISITNVGERGGSATAAGAVNAIVRRAEARKAMNDTVQGEALTSSVMDESVVMDELVPLVSNGEPHSGLPLTVDVSNRRCVVIGGGAVGFRKALVLRAHGANAVVIAPEIESSRISELASAGVTWVERAWRPGDSRETMVTVIATDDSEVNELVAADAERNNSIVLRVDRSARGQTRMSAIHRVGDVTVAVDTNGSSPRLAGYLRDKVAIDAAHWEPLAIWARANRPVTATQIAEQEVALLREAASAMENPE